MIFFISIYLKFAAKILNLFGKCKKKEEKMMVRCIFLPDYLEDFIIFHIFVA